MGQSADAWNVRTSLSDVTQRQTWRHGKRDATTARQTLLKHDRNEEE